MPQNGALHLQIGEFTSPTMIKARIRFSKIVPLDTHNFLTAAYCMGNNKMYEALLYLSRVEVCV